MFYIKLTIVIPVYNEEKVLRSSVLTVISFLKKQKISSYQIILADNFSHDKTKVIGTKLEREFRTVRYFYLPKKGRGLALKEVWQRFASDINLYFDVDLATDLSAINLVLNEFKSGAQLVIANRYLSQSKTSRSIYRLIMSKFYIWWVKLFFHTQFDDFQCGFKAIAKESLYLLKEVKDDDWFFDTELLLRAERKGLVISSIPVTWSEKGDSRVNFIKTTINYLWKTIHLKIVIGKQVDK